MRKLFLAAVLLGLVLFSLFEFCSGSTRAGADDKNESKDKPKSSLDTPKSIDLNQEIPKLEVLALKKFSAPGVGVVVASSKDLLSLHVDGVRKAGTKVKVQPGDKFHLGSDTKAFTALLFAVLVQRKLISYDLTIEQAFPEYAKTMGPSLRKVTLDLLLRHRAGFPDGPPPDWWTYARKGTTARQQRFGLMKAMLNDKKATVEPDKGFFYSNLGYVVATAMLERKLNATYEVLVKKHVFDPLKLTSAGFGQMATNKARIDQPWGHEGDGTPVEPGISADNPPIENSATGLHISLADWAKYAADQLKGAKGEKALLPAAVYKKLQEAPNKDDPHAYSIGAWIVVSAASLGLGKGNLLMHDGSNTYNYASAVIDPTRDYAILVVCNQGKKTGESTCTSIRNVLLQAMRAQKEPDKKKE